MISTTVLSRNGDLPSTDLDGELVFLSVETGKYYGIKGTARTVWELLDAPRTAEDLYTALSERFGVPPEQVEVDTRPFIEKSVAGGLLKAEPGA